MRNRVLATILLLTVQPALLYGSRSPEPLTYGTSSLIAATAGAASFGPRLTGIEVAYDSFFHVYPSAAGLFQLWTQIHIPTGAQIERMELYYRDANATDNVQARLYSAGPGQSFTIISNAFSTGSAGSYGTLATVNISPPFQVTANPGGQYVISLNFPVVDGTLSVQSVVVYYRLNVAPSPGTATFTDVPTNHVFFQYIEALAASGITSGCTVPPNPQYCPDAPLTRGQMAVFLARALGLHWAP